MKNLTIQNGRVGNDPEIKVFDSGAKKASFGLAVTESWKDKKGEWQEKTDWLDVVAWSKQADRVENQIKKGKAICVFGRLATSVWKDREGNNRKQTYIHMNGFYFVPNFKKTEDKPEALPEQKPEIPPDDDLPF